MPKKKNQRLIDHSLTKCGAAYTYLQAILKKDILVSVEVMQQCQIINEEFESGKVEANLYLFDKYIKIGKLFCKEIFPWEEFVTAICLCTFYKGTDRARWNKVLIEVGRGNGKDIIIAWWSACLTSEYHGVKHYDVDIIANNMDQSLRPINDINNVVTDKNLQDWFEKVGDSIVAYDTQSFINARSSDAKMQDGLRSGAVVFNEVHAYENYSRLNVMRTGLGKVDDPRTFYFTTNGEVRGGVLDDLIDSAKDVLNGTTSDKRFLYLLYKLDSKEEAHDPKNWVKANPSLPYRETLKDELMDEYDTWNKNPDNMPSFLQKRMNLPEMPSDQEVVPWDVILKTNQKYDYRRLEGMDCVLGIDLSKTTDWTGINLLFYDKDLDKYICLNHAFICAKNRDLSGIKAPYQEWCNNGLADMIDEKEIDPSLPVAYAFDLAVNNNYNVVHVVIDDFKKQLLSDVLDKYGFSKENENLTMVRPSSIAQIVPIIERTFINEKFVWGDNPMLRWATNNTKVIQWHNNKTTGSNDMGNQLYAKINYRFRKTDPFMAMVHSMCKYQLLNIDYVDTDEFAYRGF